MKELSIEEKAKRYDEAIERARKLYYSEETSAEVMIACENIFHELIETKDEMSKKWILEYLYDGLRKSDEQFKDHFKTAIAWLEKQGEVPVTVNIDKMVREYANNKERGNEEFGIPANCMIRAYRQGLTDAIATLVLNKQGEQKPVDKVKL